jgi:hypothetical protein
MREEHRKRSSCGSKGFRFAIFGIVANKARPTEIEIGLLAATKKHSDAFSVRALSLWGFSTWASAPSVGVSGDGERSVRPNGIGFTQRGRLFQCTTA